uniref:Ribonuclease PH n=1 Tax=uncultured prokaryote TaxID=198431 RepID=H5SEL5_9ZZZZ|nr:ribonuclease PH [uncultured prokaryote]
MDGRTAEELRNVRIVRHFLKHPEGSCYIEMGDTRVICSASVEDKVPHFLKNTGKGWITAEYSMLPRSTATRTPRESVVGRINGRTHEIQRLIGRSMRAVTKLDELGERTIWIDCDVIQADGGTRTASITGAFVALVDALVFLLKEGKIQVLPLRDSVAAVSVGKVGGEILVDLTYLEDSRAQVDMNLVMTGKGEVIEIQGTAEEMPFNKAELDRMIELGYAAIRKLTAIQREALSDIAHIWRF